MKNFQPPNGLTGSTGAAGPGGGSQGPPRGPARPHNPYGPDPGSRGPNEARGIVDSALAFLSAAGGFLRARLALLALEAKEAGGRLQLTVFFVICAIACFIMSYFLLVFGVTAFLAALIGGKFGWMWAALISTLAHVSTGAVLFAMVIHRLKTPMFEETITQLRKDQEWIANERER